MKTNIIKRKFHKSLTASAIIIEDWIVNEIINNGKDGAVVGLSGGVDSTLVAVLAKRGIDRFNAKYKSTLKLEALVMPSHISIEDDRTIAKEVIEELEINWELYEIGRITNAFYETIMKEISDYDMGNMTSRVRANLLHTYSAMNNLLVLGTGNYDEDYGIGYYTLFGDGAVHCSPIGNLSKSMVRELLAHLGYGWTSDREASAGLEPGQTDFKDLGYSYDFVGLCVYYYHRYSTKECRDMLQVLFEKDKSDYIEKFGEPKFENLQGAMADVIKRRKMAIQKAKLVSPKICAVPTTWEMSPW